jgi:hypothetical protein
MLIGSLPAEAQPSQEFIARLHKKLADQTTTEPGGDGGCQPESGPDRREPMAIRVLPPTVMRLAFTL